MKTRTITVASDSFVQLKPARLIELEMLVERGSGHSPCAFMKYHFTPTSSEIPAIYLLSFTNLQTYNLLLKAGNIVKNTEEFVSYQLEKLFSGKEVRYSVPPGTVRIFAQDLICFYNGKIWRKIEP